VRRLSIDLIACCLCVAVHLRCECM
jgi:hypothetical protein